MDVVCMEHKLPCTTRTACHTEELHTQYWNTKQYNTTANMCNIHHIPISDGVDSAANSNHCSCVSRSDCKLTKSASLRKQFLRDFILERVCMVSSSNRNLSYTKQTWKYAAENISKKFTVNFLNVGVSKNLRKRFCYV